MPARPYDPAVQVRPVADAADFLEQAGPLLLADEARHNLMLGIAGTLRDHPGTYPEQRLWLVDSTARRSWAQPCRRRRTTSSSRATRTRSRRWPPGSTRSFPERWEPCPRSRRSPAAWAARWGVDREVTMAQGIYALEELVEPAGAAGVGATRDGG